MMMLAFIVAFLLAPGATVPNFPSASPAAWMQPEAFRLSVGMARGDVVRILTRDRHKIEPSKRPEEIIVEQDNYRRVTLTFRGDRLRSLRFEMVATLVEVRESFDVETRRLERQFGKPRSPSPKKTLIYDRSSPNIIAVLTDDPSSALGKQGFGMLVVRYFEPPPREAGAADSD
ncbi:MAG TPA: hypothetical protein VMT00_15695 [Thermoanaerobaculia bacterium]|nr:hypothetical protein [Thermoanaerobaculia bacterium]